MFIFICIYIFMLHFCCWIIIKVIIFYVLHVRMWYNKADYLFLLFCVYCVQNNQTIKKRYIHILISLTCSRVPNHVLWVCTVTHIQASICITVVIIFMASGQCSGRWEGCILLCIPNFVRCDDQRTLSLQGDALTKINQWVFWYMRPVTGVILFQTKNVYNETIHWVFIVSK
jgi:hypothetical protein